MSPYTIFLYFITYAFMGWCCETTYVSLAKRKFVNRGFMYGPLCPIYGFGALLVLYVLEPFTGYPIIIFALGMIVTSILEYFTSWLMEAIFHIRWWDYSTYKYNIKGRVCLKNSLMFGVLGLVVVYGIHPVVNGVIETIPEYIQITLGAIFLFVFVCDFAFSTLGAINVDRALVEIEKLSDEIQQNGEITRQKITKKLQSMITKVEKRYNHFKKAYPGLEHNNFQFDRDIIDEVIQKMKEFIK